jgi:phosphohistidine phosphatase
MHVVKELYLLRHAKSSWDDPGLADRDRPLAPRGKRAAALIADHLRGRGIVPALVLSSDARRARQTLKAVEGVLGGRSRVLVEDELYGASAPELLDRLRSVPDAVPSVMLVGHNPGLQDLALLLSRPGGRRAAVAEKFPTGALARLQLDLAGWGQLREGAGVLSELVLPRDLA